MTAFEIVLICFFAWGALMLCAIFTFHIFKTKMNNKKFLVQNHRELWTYYCDNLEDLNELFNNKAKVRPLTEKEHMFAVMLTNHAECAYKMLRYDLVLTDKKAGLRDFASVYRKPLMNEYWKDAKQYRDPDFVKQIEKLLNTK